MLPGSTALTKTLGQQSESIHTTNLTGEWLPSSSNLTGAQSYWDNEVTDGADLRRMNGIGAGAAPWRVILDGTNDYLGATSTGYGGDPFEIMGGTHGFALNQWFKYRDLHHIFFYVGEEAPVETQFYPGGYSYLVFETVGYGIYTHKPKLTVASNDAGSRLTVTKTFTNFDFVDDTWYYVSVVFDGVKHYRLYVNGTLIDTLTTTYKLAYGTNVLSVEVGAKRIDTTVSYSGADTNVGHIHVYDGTDGSAPITNSQLRQNFLATHHMHGSWPGYQNDNQIGRIHGNTYQR